jgi:uncharacterized membrane protein YeiB
MRQLMERARRVELATEMKGLATSGLEPGARIEGFDLARALAFLGMVFVNFRVALATEEGSPRWLTWLDTRLDGRAAATFVILAGVSLSLLSRRARGTGDAALAGVRRTLFRRAAFLFVVGLLYWSIWPADILHYYGVFLAVGALLLNAPDRRLLGLASILVVLFALLLVLGADYNAGWDWRTLTYHGFWTPTGFVRNLSFNGFHPVVPWLAFLVLGMWLGRRDLRNPEVWRRLFLTGLVVAVASETVSRLLVAVAIPELCAEDAMAVFGTAPMPPKPLYMLAASGTSIVVIVLCVRIAERFAVARWLAPLVATGQLALTLYVAHVVIGLAPLEELGLGHGPRSVAFSAVWGAAFCVVAVSFSHFWRSRFSRGPLEMVMRRFAPG